MRIAIERPSGLIVDALVEAGHQVFPIHPNAVKASRPRYRSHGAKSDASDAYLLADLLRTDGHRWAALSPQSDSIRALRALVRARDDLVAARIALANQLRTTLEAFWPGAAFPRAGRVCAAQILAELVDVRERYPTADRLAAEAGVVPLTYESGKKRCVGFRWACNHHLRRAITTWPTTRATPTCGPAASTRPHASACCDHPHAIRILARAWLRVIWRAWFDRQPYNPEHHFSAARASAQGG